MTRRWLPAWGLAAVAFGGGSLIVPLYVVELGGDAFVLGAMALTVATMAAIPLLRVIPLVIAANALLWLGFAAATPVLTLLVVDREPESAWSDRIASLNKYQGTGWAAGLALGLRTLPPDPAPEAAPSPRRLRRRVREAVRFNIRGAAFSFTPGRIDVRQFHPRTFVRRFSPALALYFAAVFCVFTGFGAFFAPLPAYLTEVGYGSSGIFGLYLVLNAGAAAFYGRVAGLTGAREATTVQAGGLLARGLAFPLVLLVGAVVGRTLLGTGAVVLVFGLIGGSLGATSYPLTFGAACGLVVVGAALVLLVGRKDPTA